MIESRIDEAHITLLVEGMDEVIKEQEKNQTVDLLVPPIMRIRLTFVYKPQYKLDAMSDYLLLDFGNTD